MCRRSLVLATLMASWPNLGLAQPIIGDIVADLGEEVSWLHGQEVPTYVPGSVYVLDFWATWCPPCYPMIDRLTELAREHREAGLVIVGIAVGTNLGVPLERFLEKEKERIAYSIAKPEDEDRLKERLVHPAFVDPTTFSLPTLVIVDRQGRLAWVSDPADPEKGFEETLASVMAGTYDLASAAHEAREQVATWVKKGERLAEMRALRSRGATPEAARMLVSLTADSPAVFAPDAADVFVEMICSGEEESASAYARALLDHASLARVPELVRMERAILYVAREGRRDYELAERLGRRALLVRGGDHPDFLYELAKVAHARGDGAAAQELRGKAVRAAESQGWDENYRRVIGSVPFDVVMAQQAAEFRRQCAAFRPHPPTDRGLAE